MMFPVLGEYSFAVLAAYGAMLALIIGLVVFSLRAAQTSKDTLAKLERKRKRND